MDIYRQCALTNIARPIFGLLRATMVPPLLRKTSTTFNKLLSESFRVLVHFLFLADA